MPEWRSVSTDMENRGGMELGMGTALYICSRTKTDQQKKNSGRSAVK